MSDLAFCFGLPAVMGALVGWFVLRLAPGDISKRYAAAIAFAAAFFVGCEFLLDWELRPERHWHWLPWLVCAAAFVGPMAQADGLRQLERWSAFLLLSLVSAWLLTPTWESLKPPRPIFLAILTAYLTLLSAALVGLPKRVSPGWLASAMTISSLTVTVLVAALVNLSYGQVAGAATAALGGLSLFLMWCSGGEATERMAATQQTMAAVVPAYAVAVLGIAFVAAIYPKQMPWPLFLAPAAPLMLWCVAIGPLAKLQGVTGHVTRATLVAIPLAIAAALCWRMTGLGAS